MTGPDPTVTRADRDTYLALLGDTDEDGAIGFAHAVLDRGVPAQRLLLDLVAAAQAWVGEQWATAAWSVAQEHAATHISERVIAAVAGRTSAAAAGRSRTARGQVVVACVDGEWHSLPARLLAEVLRLHGWSVRFLGASVPTPHLISYLHQHGPDAVAVSCSLPTRLPKAHRVIEAAQSAGVPVLAGGAGFGPDARWARQLGADRAAASADDAVTVLGTWPPPLLAGPADLPHLADDEHTIIAKRRAELVDVGIRALAERFAPMRQYSPARLEATRDDLGDIVDFLAAGLFVDDPELFGAFIAWLGGILDSRDVPGASVGLVLDAYAQTLYDFPRTRTHLAAGRGRI